MKLTNLIIFFIPPEKVVNGGIMSIFSLCKESRRFTNIHGSEVVICTYPGTKSYKKNDLFENDEIVYDFDEIITKWKNPKKVIFHITETGVRLMNKTFGEEKYKKYVRKLESVHINILNQNIRLMRRPAEVAELFSLTSNVTQTTAHYRYTTQELSDTYQTPVKHFSVFIDPNQYRKPAYTEKENLIIYSPDENTDKPKIVKAIESIKGYKSQEVRGIPYEEYKKLAAKAKFCITFGEGFDGYLIESFFSGGVGIAVYNDEFFPDKSFLDLPSIFDDYGSMGQNIVNTIKSLDNEASFSSCSARGRSKVEKIYQYETYLKKIEDFYRDKYDFTPKPGTATKIIKDMLRFRDETIQAQIRSRDELKLKLADQEKELKQLEAKLQSILNSHSWKVTKPLRKIKKKLY